METTPRKSTIGNLLGDESWHDAGSLTRALGAEAPSKRQLLRMIEELVGPVVTDLKAVTSVDGKNLNPVVLPPPVYAHMVN